MSICLVSQDLYKSNGPGTYIKHLSHELENKGIKFTLVCPKRRDKDTTNYLYFPINCEKIEIPNFPYFSSNFSFGINAAAEIKRNYEKKFELVHVLNTRGYIPIGDIHTIGTIHDSYAAGLKLNIFELRKFYYDWLIRYFYNSFIKISERYTLQKFFFLIYNSYFTAKTITSKYNIPPEKGKIIYCGIPKPPLPSENFHQLRTKYSPNQEKVILFIGMNLQRKGLQFLIKAVSLIVSKISVKVIVIGGWTITEVRRMHQLCKDYGVESKFIFLRRIPYPQIFDYYYLADVLVVPSLIEAFGLVYLEAMSAGTPVVSGRYGGTAEFIKNGYNGFTIDPLNIQELARIIEEILTNPHLRNKLIKNGKVTADQFSIKKMVDETTKLYYDLLSARATDCAT